MKPTKTVAEKYRLFFTLFFPILIYQFANYSASFIDTMMTGQYHTQDLAGVSMATSLWNPFLSLVTGVVSALVPIIGNYLGSGQTEKVRDQLHQFLYLVVGLGLLLLGFIWLVAIPILGTFGLEREVLAVSKGYLVYLSWGIFPLLFFSVFRSFLDALGMTRLSMYFMLLLVPFNSFFNYILIYGKLGLPSLGGAGAGLGTALSYWLVLLVILVVMSCHPQMKLYRIWQFTPFNGREIKQALALGLPIGLQIFAEVAIFAVVGLLMAAFSSQIIAAHQAAMNFATLLYAFPVSVASTMPIIISYEIGAKRYQDVLTYGRIGRLVALVFACFTMSFLYIFRSKIAILYGSDPAFIELASAFLTYALFFQLGDAYTAPLQGILRGYKDTTMPFIIGICTYWSVALPVGLALDKLAYMGPEAYWIGLIVGIVSCGILLHIRLNKLANREKEHVFSTC